MIEFDALQRGFIDLKTTILVSIIMCLFCQGQWIEYEGWFYFIKDKIWKYMNSYLDMNPDDYFKIEPILFQS